VEKGIRKLFAKENRNNLAKILQVFFFWKRKKKSIKRLSLEITSLSLSLHEKQLCGKALF